MVKKVLVIEDNAAERELLVRLLKKSGFIILEAKNGEEGITKAIDTLPAIIFCDMRMPKKNGYDVANELRECEATRYIPLVAVTTLFANLLEAEAEGFNGLVFKPPNEESIEQAMKLVLP